MLEIYDEYADSSVQELVQTANLIEIYAENTMTLIDDMESAEAFRNSYFTEATEEAENAASNAANKNIFAKIAESISKIFSKLASILSKGKTVAKAAKQNSDLKKIGSAVQNFPAVKLKIQDVWSYNKFVEDTMDKHIKKFDKKTTLNLFNRTLGEGKAIDVLTKNMMQMASEMRVPSNRKFVIGGPGIKKLVGGAGVIAGGTGALSKVLAKKSTIPLGMPINLKTAGFDMPLVSDAANKALSGAAALKKGLTHQLSEMPTNLKTAGFDMPLMSAAANKALSGAAVANASHLSLNAILTGATAVIGAHGPLIAGTAVVLAGLVILAKVFGACPKKIGTEQVTIQELYKRISSLDPEKFPSNVAATAATVNKYMQQASTLNTFVNSTDGSKGATAYASKVSSLLTAYTQFHQALIDFYLSIIISILKEGGVQSSKKIYKPTEMVKSESTTDSSDNEYNEFEPDIENYEECVDDMTNYMDLESFIENDLSDMAY